MSEQELPEDEEWAKDEYGNYIYENESAHRFFDELYIENFCNNPSAGKTDALRRSGCKVKALKQKAYKMHRRLIDRIEKRLDEIILDGAHIGHSTLVHLCKDSDSDTVKAKCAKDLIDFAGRKAGERVTVTHEMGDEERDSEIIRLQADIKAQEGNRKLDS